MAEPNEVEVEKAKILIEFTKQNKLEAPEPISDVLALLLARLTKRVEALEKK